VVIDLGKLSVRQYSYGLSNNKAVAVRNFYLSFGLITKTDGQLRLDISHLVQKYVVNLPRYCNDISFVSQHLDTYVDCS
jgi:hypothetical protein